MSNLTAVPTTPAGIVDLFQKEHGTILNNPDLTDDQKVGYLLAVTLRGDMLPVGVIAGLLKQVLPMLKR